MSRRTHMKFAGGSDPEFRSHLGLGDPSQQDRFMAIGRAGEQFGFGAFATEKPAEHFDYSGVRASVLGRCGHRDFESLAIDRHAGTLRAGLGANGQHYPFGMRSEDHYFFFGMRRILNASVSSSFLSSFQILTTAS